ncbi:ester cyclase [Mycolicibacterium litorale]|uniref:ester cyclase n=1 Tax=Mycolicibacterium litorale TaxID=758802 RepID=UPI003CF639BA
MATDRNDAETLYRRWIGEVWAGEPIPADLVSDDFVGHWPDRDVHGRDGLAAIIDQTRKMFDHLRFEVVVGPLSDGELLAGRWRGTGSQPTGQVGFTGNDILRIRDGRVVEYWTGTSAG